MEFGKVITPGGLVSVVVVVGGLFVWGGEKDEQIKGLTVRQDKLSDRMAAYESGGALVQRELSSLAATLDAVQVQQNRIYGLLTEGKRK